LADALRELGKEVVVPQMPTPQGQTLENWFESFSMQVGEVDSKACIIGHSIGAVFLLRYLERSVVPLGSSVFVAGLLGAIGIPEYDHLNETFVAASFDWATIRRNAGHIVCLAGDNDPYVPFSQQSELAEKLGVAPHIILNGGHLNAESGYERFPALLKKLQEAR